MKKKLQAPFPYFGGKSRVAEEVWERFGILKNYVEPFAGSCAVLLARPFTTSLTEKDPESNYFGIETVNDADGLVSNFWRALAMAPLEVARHANWQVNEADLHARHLWLVNKKESLTDRLMADPDWFDSKAAGWWVWGACSWIGQGWCRGDGPWNSENGRFTKGNSEVGVNRQIPHIGNAGRGINKYVEAEDPPQELPGYSQVLSHLRPIAERIRNVRVACGDWSRVLGDSVTHQQGMTGVFLDPPYSEGTVDYNEGDRNLSSKVRNWCLSYGDHPKMRIALCGYEGEHNILEDHDWRVWEWQAAGGYGVQGEGQGRKNSSRERIWFSPHCAHPGKIVENFPFGNGNK